MDSNYSLSFKNSEIHVHEQGKKVLSLKTQVKVKKISYNEYLSQKISGFNKKINMFEAFQCSHVPIQLKPKYLVSINQTLHYLENELEKDSRAYIKEFYISTREKDSIRRSIMGNDRFEFFFEDCYKIMCKNRTLKSISETNDFYRLIKMLFINYINEQAVYRFLSVLTRFARNLDRDEPVKISLGDETTIISLMTHDNNESLLNELQLITLELESSVIEKKKHITNGCKIENKGLLMKDAIHKAVSKGDILLNRIPQELLNIVASYLAVPLLHTAL